MRRAPTEPKTLPAFEIPTDGLNGTDADGTLESKTFVTLSNNQAAVSIGEAVVLQPGGRILDAGEIPGS